MTGRPSSYSQETADELCEWIANGRSLTGYCQQEGKPSFASIYRWLADPEREGFREAYAYARETQGHADADHINLVAEELRQGDMASDVARVIVDAMKWTAARRAPKVYGDKVQLSNDTNAPLVITWANGDKV